MFEIMVKKWLDNFSENGRTDFPRKSAGQIRENGWTPAGNLLTISPAEQLSEKNSSIHNLDAVVGVSIRIFCRISARSPSRHQRTVH